MHDFNSEVPLYYNRSSVNIGLCVPNLYLTVKLCFSMDMFLYPGVIKLLNLVTHRCWMKTM